MELGNKIKTQSAHRDPWAGSACRDLLVPLLSNQSNRNVVQIFSADWSRLYATELTVPVLQRRPASQAEVSFAERRHDRPEALLTWFYRGMLTGHEFIYPAREEQRLDRDARQRILAPLARVTGGSNSARISGM